MVVEINSNLLLVLQIVNATHLRLCLITSSVLKKSYRKTYSQNEKCEKPRNVQVFFV